MVKRFKKRGLAVSLETDNRLQTIRTYWLSSSEQQSLMKEQPELLDVIHFEVIKRKRSTSCLIEKRGSLDTKVFAKRMAINPEVQDVGSNVDFTVYKGKSQAAIGQNDY